MEEARKDGKIVSFSFCMSWDDIFIYDHFIMLFGWTIEYFTMFHLSCAFLVVLKIMSVFYCKSSVNSSPSRGFDNWEYIYNDIYN